MSQNNDPEAEKPQKRRRGIPQAWWLPLAFLASILIHFVAGVGTYQLGKLWLTPPEEKASAETVSVTFRSPQAVEPSKQSKEPSPKTKAETQTAPQPVETTPPQPEPQKPQVQPEPQVQPKTVVTTQAPRPPKVLTSVPIRQNVPVEMPRTTRNTANITAPRTTSKPIQGELADRLPEPLPVGELQGDTQIAPLNRENPRPTVRRTTAVARTPETEEGGGSGSTLVPRPADPANATSPAPGAGETTGGVIGTGRGPKTGRGAGNALGIDRGIPFGSKTGLYGGNPAGGGAGRGPSGVGEVSASRRPDGSFNLSFKRTPPEGSGPPMNIVYVLDVSASMERSQKMKRAQEALNEALDELSPEDTFTLVTFGNHAKALSRPLKATRANLSVGHANVNAAIPEPGSNTNMEAGLEMALRQPNVTHIFVLSDGEPTEGETDPERLLDLVRRKNRNSARIITFALIGSDNEEFGAEFLKRLAEEGEGIFRSVKLK